ncbi:dTDP-4-dehydrorhamnose reductase [Prosthecochloris sp. GSB1]|uniref:dTDP-4-dehydrorhamnose reductase n=1 Tax=Prosthecochloris sp. GSB1 TaxID=281093 RepID=UPI000B8CF86E|nr:dTDP-4-dehydrorhamnose reductase [Prosthecochloris sp. GSB1]ASQ89966.1 dTDP-4-dehydrorhamnose reductase [Prosthecochloris sp. GSB1]
MNILVTGSGGQLGSEFRALESRYPGHRFFFFGRADLDIRDEAALRRVMTECRPDVVLNCAAFTSVDEAENNSGEAFALNRDAPGRLAGVTRDAGALLVHFSTYYVFDGKGHTPYRESDAVSPSGIYALSKYEGEQRVRSQGGSYTIIRTGWLYSRFGRNFVKTMLKLGAEKEVLDVISDRVGSPAYAGGLAASVMRFVDSTETERSYADVWHYADRGVCSWYDLAAAVMRLANLSCRVRPVDGSSFPTKGPRPWYSVMDSSAIENAWNLDIPHWHDALETMLRSC